MTFEFIQVLDVAITTIKQEKTNSCAFTPLKEHVNSFHYQNMLTQRKINVYRAHILHALNEMCDQYVVAG